jgi:hypothetical protein
MASGKSNTNIQDVVLTIHQTILIRSTIKERKAAQRLPVSLFRRKKEQRPDFALFIVFNHGIAIGARRLFCLLPYQVDRSPKTKTKTTNNETTK